MQRTDVPQIGSISRLVFGSGSIGGRVSEKAALRAMAVAFEAGITTFDVARSYGYGEAEAVLGQFLRGRRDRAQIITKAGIVARHSPPALRLAKTVARKIFAIVPRARRLARPALGSMHVGGHFEPQELEASLVTSLQKLRTDHVDALLLHACGIEVLERDDVREKLASFVTRGMTRRIGVASGAAEAARWLELGSEPTAELPASELDRVAPPQSGALWLANQPFGGGALLARAKAACASSGMPTSNALQYLLQRPFSRGASAVVLSMLDPEHVQLALRALEMPQLDAGVRARLEVACEEQT